MTIVLSFQVKVVSDDIVCAWIGDRKFSCLDTLEVFYSNSATIPNHHVDGCFVGAWRNAASCQ